LATIPDRSFQIEGHTDDVGQIAYNVDLSRRRAEAVRDALVLRGVAPERLRARGFGPSRPLVEGDTDAARAANRRVTFVVVESVDGR
jgi:outer membrane protein OmpA-like peptidoglycan-associated protein